jgi:small subunit ribosomal protein S9
MPERSIHVGRRKSAVARAAISRGSGQFTLNGKPLEEYFTTEKLRAHVLEPFETIEQVGQWDVSARLKGGGTTGQAGALRMAIARALVAEDGDLRASLKSAGLLTRDARKVERKKYGLKKARRAPQFSKR